MSRRCTMPGRRSPWSSRSSGKRASKPLTSVPLSLPGRGMDHHPGRLVDDDHGRIFEDDLERRPLRSGGSSSWRGAAAIETRSPATTRWPGFAGWPLSQHRLDGRSDAATRNASGRPRRRGAAETRRARSPAANGGTTTMRPPGSSRARARRAGFGARVDQPLASPARADSSLAGVDSAFSASNATPTTMAESATLNTGHQFER